MVHDGILAGGAVEEGPTRKSRRRKGGFLFGKPLFSAGTRALAKIVCSCRTRLSVFFDETNNDFVIGIYFVTLPIILLGKQQ